MGRSNNNPLVSIALKFVGRSCRFDDAEMRLRKVISISSIPVRATTFSKPDVIYAEVLSAYPRWETMKSVLRGILAEVNLTTIEVVFGVEKTEINHVLEALGSFVRVSKSYTQSEYEILLEPVFGPCHEHGIFISPEFREFLEDGKRSGPFYVNITDAHDALTRAFFGKIHKNLDDGYKTDPHLSMNMGLTAYRRLMSDIAIQIVPYSKTTTLISLITKMDRRIQDIPLNFPFLHSACLVQDMDLLDMALLQTQGRKGDTVPQTDHKTGPLLHAISALRKKALKGRKEGVRVLSATSLLELTPMIAYIHLIGEGEGVPVKALFALPGSTDTIAKLRKARHIVKIGKVGGILKVWLQCLDGLLPNSSESEIPDETLIYRLARMEWTNGRTLLAYDCLMSLMVNLDNDWEIVVERTRTLLCVKKQIIGEFFDSFDMFDIRTEEYFLNPCTLAMLDLVLNAESWTASLPLRPRSWEIVKSVIGPAIFWFNRQLTDPRAVELMKNYDKNLPHKMANTMKKIFEHCFLPALQTPYFSELRVTTFVETGERSIKINVKPLSTVLQKDKFYFEEEIAYTVPEIPHSICIQRFHDEIFGGVLLTESSDSKYTSILERSSWYPHLAAFLLNVLVKHQHSKVFPGFLGQEYYNFSPRFFSYLIPCLPYAHTSQKNLDAFRALSYLSIQATWHAPLGFCDLAWEFVKKYQPSILSTEERSCFKKWLCHLKKFEDGSTRTTEKQNSPALSLPLILQSRHGLNVINKSRED